LPPAPLTTATRISESPSTAAQKSASASYMAMVMALRASGRSMVAVATGPANSVCTFT
jgi:hypothetical protein